MEKKLVKVLLLLLVASFLVLAARLFQLQVLRGKENRFLAENNRVRKVIIKSPRGIILDRHGKALAKSDPVYFLIDGDNNRKEIDRNEALKLQAEGKRVEISSKRVYTAGSDFGHVIGYLGEVSQEELIKDKLELQGYGLGSLIGRNGIELQYESLLKGRDGSELVEVDTSGKISRRMRKTLPDPGKVLTLSIDSKLQEVAARQMEGRKGAVIATRPLTGEVLIFYSSPSFDPNIFLDKERQNELNFLIKDEENRPLLNRAISGLYPPGSTFKVVTVIAGLEEGKITQSTLINDPGVIIVNNFKYANWYFAQYGRTEGEVNLTKALARSTDTYFYKVGEYLGAESLVKWAKIFNLDEKFGIDLPSELPGFIGSPEWKKKSRNESWFLGNTYHLAIGQGDIDLTPLGVNLMMAVVASGGKLCQPRMLRIGAENTFYKEECKDLGIKKEFLETVKKGMIGACSSGGTGWPFFDFKIKGLPANESQHEPYTNSIEKASAKTGRVACKTGTAETGDGKTSHAWFTVFAPACAESSGEAKPSCEPEIVLTVLVERGGEGSSVAGPIAKEILKEYF